VLSARDVEKSTGVPASVGITINTIPIWPASRGAIVGPERDAHLPAWLTFCPITLPLGKRAAARRVTSSPHPPRKLVRPKRAGRCRNPEGQPVTGPDLFLQR
jgi:hypothetical protein